MEKNIAEMLEEEKEYFNRRNNEKQNEKTFDWNCNKNRRSCEKQTRNSVRNATTENINNWPNVNSTKKKMDDQQFMGLVDNGELTNGHTKNKEEKIDLQKGNKRRKTENKLENKEVNRDQKREELTEQKKKEEAQDLGKIGIKNEEKIELLDTLKHKTNEEVKFESSGLKEIESNEEDKKKEKKQNRNDGRSEGTVLTTISAKKKEVEIKQNNLNKNESVSLPASMKKRTQFSKSKHTILKSLNIRSGSVNGSTTLNIYDENKSSESKNKKKNENESSKQHILNMLSKRVKCLTTVEHTKDYDCNLSAMNRLTNNKEYVSDNNNINSNKANVVDNKEAVLLLLTRDFRVNDNWALIYAYKLAEKKGCNLMACTYLNRKEKQYNRHINIKLKILKDMETNMKQLNIPFYILLIYMIDEFAEFVRSSNVKTIICDFNPLKPYKTFITNLTQIAMGKKIKIFQIDTHNIIPVWVTSNEEEMNARVIRKKIKENLLNFLTEFITLKPFKQNILFPEPFDMIQVIRKLSIDTSAPILYNFEYTEHKALQLLKTFCYTELEKYNFKKDDPNCHINNILLLLVSLGLLSSQRCALQANYYAVKKPSVNSVSGKEAFHDQIIIKKELADNFCYFNKNYDNLEGAENWARETLEKHENDKREYIYEYEDLRDAKTHDDIWNCSQLQLVTEGLINGHLKVYWAKQILNWTSDPKTALTYAFELYKNFSIDSISTINCVIIMKSILGVHDVSCAEKNIVGKIRYMSYNECRKRFNAELYMSKFSQGKENAILIKKIPTVTFATYLKKRKRNSYEINKGKKEKT